MAESSLPQRVPIPPLSAFSGEQYVYLSRLATALNQMPPFSYYSGNPNSALTANIGHVVVNIGSSADTARVWVKEYGSSNTGWSSLATA